MFDESYIKKLPKEPLEAASEFCHDVSEEGLIDDFEAHEEFSKKDSKNIFALIYILSNRINNKISSEISQKYGEDPEMTDAALKEFCERISDIKEDEEMEEMVSRFSDIYEESYIYEFTDGDFNRIQEILNEMRNIVQGSDDFDEDYKNRVLKKIETLQSELHKFTSDLDRFWGFIGEAGVALGKFGENAKPFVDRVKELMSIIWRTQAHHEELPSGTDFPGKLPDTGNSQEDT